MLLNRWRAKNKLEKEKRERKNTEKLWINVSDKTIQGSSEIIDSIEVHVIKIMTKIFFFLFATRSLDERDITKPGYIEWRFI